MSFGYEMVHRYIKSLTLSTKSPLWKLKLFSLSFFKRFALCYLHLGPLGNIRRHLKYIGLKMGETFCEGTNSRIFTNLRLITLDVNIRARALTNDLDLVALPKGIYKTKGNTQSSLNYLFNTFCR